MGVTGEAAGGEHLTERQKKWFATVQANFEKQTGRPLADWVEIVRRDCPHETPRARAQWLKDTHGIGVNHAAHILYTAFPSGPNWDDAEALRARLWSDPASAAILDAVLAAARELEGLVVGQRKSFTGLSRGVQFAALRPLKGGKALIGFKLDAAASPRLKPAARKESWSERLTAVLELASPAEVNGEVKRLLREAFANG